MTGCMSHHPVDCALGIPWSGCLEGTAGYINGVGKRINEDAQKLEMAEKEPSDSVLFRELSELDELRKKGIITEEEFIELKKKILTK